MRVGFGHIQVIRCKSLAWTTDSVRACADQRSRLSRDEGAPAHAHRCANCNSARKQVHFDPRDSFGYFLIKESDKIKSLRPWGLASTPALSRLDATAQCHHTCSRLSRDLTRVRGCWVERTRGTGLETQEAGRRARHHLHICTLAHSSIPRLITPLSHTPAFSICQSKDYTSLSRCSRSQALRSHCRQYDW